MLDSAPVVSNRTRIKVKKKPAETSGLVLLAAAKLTRFNVQPASSSTDPTPKPVEEQPVPQQSLGTKPGERYELLLGRFVGPGLRSSGPSTRPALGKLFAGAEVHLERCEGETEAEHARRGTAAGAQRKNAQGASPQATRQCSMHAGPQ